MRIGRARKRLVSVLLWVPLLLLVAGWAVCLRPQALGGPAAFVVVHGDSMLPHFVTGDLVVLRQETAYHTGEVIAYRVPKGEIGAGAIVIHRIIGGSGSTGFVVKGDNNPAPDPWHPHAANVVGGLLWHIPGVGSLLARMRLPAVMAALAAAVAVATVVAYRRKPMAAPAADLSDLPT